MPQFFRVVEHTINCAHSREYATATANGDADRPRLAVKQYIPLDNPNPQPGDVTIIAAHANGFPKELYEPLWDELQKKTAETGIRIRSIWIADMWNQGQSGVLNEKILGNDPSWWDHTRDLANLINQKRDEMPQPLVGMGHSMGGAQLTYLALCHPRLLYSLVLLDPVITTSHSGIGPAAASTNRRDIWDSRAAAAAKFAQSPFYRAWDPRVLDLWIHHGLRALPTEIYPSHSSGTTTTPGDTPVTLTTTKHQELFTFLRPTYHPSRDLRDFDPSGLGLGPEAAAAANDRGKYPKFAFYRPEPLQAFARLPELRPSVLYVFGGKSEMSRPEERRAKMERTGSGLGGSGGVAGGRVREVVLDCGHLVAMERVGECAEAAGGFLGAELERWGAEERVRGEGRRVVGRRGVIMVDERWKREIKGKI
ncbi:Alpha/beta hydrolase family-domain-containing protein [Chaetomium fimeti]|uniref:Alpha/beta hydrolase family-domain-containing protein n=1 Tax=Chaetomium fimeti TaxID=1854472 RepID=A0AAE0H8P6_9PEZI|nr:Alpha/beta hydrolase family-domain-containing protein [Chaetomium fimeti]